MQMPVTPEKKSLSPLVWVAIAIGAIALLCVCVGAAGLILFSFASQTPEFQQFEEVFESAQGNPTHAPVEVTPFVLPEGYAEGDASLGADAEMLANTVVPPRDIPTLGIELLGLGGVPTTIEREPFQMGDVETFYVTNDDTESTVEVEAELVYIADNVYMWVQQGIDYDEGALSQSAETFSGEIVPTNRENFGMETSPGVDGDPRLHILHSDELGSSIAGYFGSADSYPRAYSSQSNEKEMFYINISNTFPGTDDYLSTLTHEYQHMIHWSTDKNESTWLNEGMSEMASFLNGFGPSWFSAYYFSTPEIQLTTWPEEDSSLPYYGGAYLFAQYFHDRFGIEATQQLVANDQNGLESVNDTLAALGADVTANEVFMDWTIANLLDDPSVPHPLSGDTGLYSYESIDASSMSLSSSMSHITPYETISAPISGKGYQVNQFGAQYLLLNMEGDVTISFDGTEYTNIIPVETANTDDDATTSDRFVWWSNRGDDSSMTLSRELDLTGVETATLEYDIWFWLEDEWDFGYLEVSTDDGETFEMLETPYTTTSDPFGNNYGVGYTGMSANLDEDADGWLHESIDLSEYAGSRIIIRFQHINDDAVNQPGLAIDNIHVPEIGFSDDVENGSGDWQAAGFARITNILEQQFGVQVVTLDRNDNAQVSVIPLDDQNQGTMMIAIPEGGSAYIVVSGITGFTTQPTVYTLTIN